MAQLIPLDPDLVADEAVMQCAIEHMADLSHLMAAAYRLAANPNYVRAVAELATARRAKNTLAADLAAAELMWLIEDEVLAQCRREYAAHPHHTPASKKEQSHV